MRSNHAVPRPLQRATLILLALACSGWIPATALPLPVQDSPSLQEVLRELRRQREQRFATRKVDVERWVEDLEQVGDSSSPPASPLSFEELAKIGDEFAPLLLPHLDPTQDADGKIGRGQMYRAARIADVLRGMNLIPVLDDLLELANKGNREAIRVLGAAPAERAQEVFTGLQTLFRGSSNTAVRSRALLAMVELGGDQLPNVMRSALSEKDDNLVGTAIDALAEARSEQALDSMVEFASSSRATAHVNSLIDYFLIFEEVDEEHGAVLLRLATREQLNVKARIAALERMRKIAFDDRGEVKSVAKKLLKSSSTSSSMREAIQVLLAYKGDGGAKRDALKHYDELIDRDQKFPRGYIQRGDVLYKMGDYRRALADYRKALELQANQARDSAAFLGAARCCALTGNLKKAASYLRDSPLTSTALRALAKDPDFSELAKDGRYNSVFKLTDQ